VYTVLVYPDKKIYAEVSDRAVVAVLRTLVNG
jgi:(2Fe-2S) ferredoxin